MITRRDSTMALIAHLLLLAGLALPALAQSEIDEDALFSDTSSIIDSAAVVRNDMSAGDAESTTVDLTGQVTSVAAVSLSRKLIDRFERSYITPDAYIAGNLYLDVRLPFGVKSFADVEARYPAGSSSLAPLPSVDDTVLWIREMFLDVTIGRLVYIRSGKQVLQWGRCFFWNPTDLVNVERRSFVQKIGSREGTFGIRTHVPFGTTANLYGFLDLNRPSSIDSIAGAAKAEYLWHGIESALSIWSKPHSTPVFGLDFSAPLFSLTLTGEASITKGKNYPMVVAAATRDTASWIPRVCAGVSGAFDLMEVDDRLTVSAEFYYNNAGVNHNYFADIVGASQDLGAFFSDPDAVARWGRYIAAYEPNSYSKYYAAAFTSVSKFIISDLTLSVNALGNLQQRCATITTGLTYRTMHNFSAGASITGFVGPDNTEYTFTNNGALVQLTAGVAF